MTYTLIIGTKNWSSWSLRAWLAMRATGSAFEEIVIPLRQPETPEIAKFHSPSARVPALKIRDGGEQVTVFDSLAICEALAERHPEAGLWPTDPAARAVARSYAAEMHSGFLALREALPMDFARTLDPPPIDAIVEEEIARVQSAWTDALNAHPGGGFLFGPFTVADCMYAPVVSRFVTYGIPMSDQIRDYCERIAALPAMQAWHAASEQEIAAGLPDQWVVEMVRNKR